jgi:signal transduction histidine kinase
MSLRFKTVLGVALIEAFLLALLIGTVVSHQHRGAEQSLQKRAHTTATLFASTTKDPLLSLDLASLESFSQELMGNPDLVYVRVLDANGQPYAEAGDPALLATPFVADHVLDEVTDGVFDASANIMESDIVYGRVELGFDIHAITKELDDTLSLGVGIAVVEMLLVGLFSLLLGTYLTRQLRILRSTAKKISEGDYTTRIPVTGHDEVAEVSIAFNRMSIALHESQISRDKFEAQLIELNHTLEDKVERRTAQIKQQVTELQAANDKIEDTQAQLIQSEKLASVGQLAAGVAHEINNPIGFVRSNLTTLIDYIETYQTLLQKYQSAHQLPEDARLDAIAEIRKIEDKQDIEFINEDITELVNDSVDGTTRVRDIVQGLSDFSHMGAKNRALCNLNDCLESTLKIVKNGLKKQCSIETHLQSVPMVIANKGELNQILMNLLVNAGQAVDDGGCIRIESSQLTCDNGEYVQVTIEDNGSGIDPEHLDKLFDPFFTTKPVGEGTGMGLAISYGIIKDHDGEIAVESEPGVGTKFTIRLPIGTDAELQQAA